MFRIGAFAPCGIVPEQPHVPVVDPVQGFPVLSVPATYGSGWRHVLAVWCILMATVLVYR